jgi:hypothetical protein
MERRFLSLLLLDDALEDLRFEAREISEDERQKRLTELKDERDALDLDEKGWWKRHIVSFRQRVGVLTLAELISMYSLND